MPNWLERTTKLRQASGIARDPHRRRLHAVLVEPPREQPPRELLAVERDPRLAQPAATVLEPRRAARQIEREAVVGDLQLELLERREAADDGPAEADEAPPVLEAQREFEGGNRRTDGLHGGSSVYHEAPTI